MGELAPAFNRQSNLWGLRLVKGLGFRGCGAGVASGKSLGATLQSCENLNA